MKGEWPRAFRSQALVSIAWRADGSQGESRIGARLGFDQTGDGVKKSDRAPISGRSMQEPPEAIFDMGSSESGRCRWAAVAALGLLAWCCLCFSENGAVRMSPLVRARGQLLGLQIILEIDFRIALLSWTHALQSESLPPSRLHAHSLCGQA